MRKEEGSIGNLLTVCICMLFMSVLMLRFFDSVQLINEKMEINQIARRYILRMETTGYLSEEDMAGLTSELSGAGAEALDFSGTTRAQTSYGETIVLRFYGKLRGQFEFEEERVSTAKN